MRHGVASAGSLRLAARDDQVVPLVLSDAERASLEALSRKRTASQSLAERARVVLACADEGGVAPLTRVAAQDRAVAGVGPQVAGAVHGAPAGRPGDAPRPGAARKITDEQVEVLVTRTLTEKGRGQDSHWSTRSMAPRPACRSRRSPGSGGRSASSRTSWRPGS